VYTEKTKNYHKINDKFEEEELSMKNFFSQYFGDEITRIVQEELAENRFLELLIK
jgi:hypothetical protein